MKKLIVLLTVLLSLNGCEGEESGPECPPNASCIAPESVLQAELDSLRIKILEETNASCVETSECKIVGLGAKPCGGPWEYLIYSSTDDTINILNMVENYNSLEASINERFGRGSDCALAIPPDSLVCEGGKCVAYSMGEAYEGTCCQ